MLIVVKVKERERMRWWERKRRRQGIREWRRESKHTIRYDSIRVTKHTTNWSASKILITTKFNGWAKHGTDFSWPNRFLIVSKMFEPLSVVTDVSFSYVMHQSSKIDEMTNSKLSLVWDSLNIFAAKMILAH